MDLGTVKTSVSPPCMCTVLVLRMAHRKWKETKQQSSMLPGPSVPGSCLVSFHILWTILSTSTVLFADFLLILVVGISIPARGLSLST